MPLSPPKKFVRVISIDAEPVDVCVPIGAAGENLAEVLKQRPTDLAPPIQM